MRQAFVSPFKSPSHSFSDEGGARQYVMSSCCRMTGAAFSFGGKVVLFDSRKLYDLTSRTAFSIRSIADNRPAEFANIKIIKAMPQRSTR